MPKKIFVADDSITIQKVVELTFSEDEYEVFCAPDGAQAIQRLEEIRPDIALLDVVMPEANGYDVCSHIKKNPDLSWMPVVLLAGTFEPFDEKRARDVGADGHMKKPFESRALVARVVDLLAANPRPGAEVAQAVAGPAEAKTVEPPPESSPAVMTPSAAAAAAPPPPPPPSTGQVPRDLLETVTREAVSDVAEKIVREVAWEVIPDLAEAIIRKRIRELEEEAERREP